MMLGPLITLAITQGLVRHVLTILGGVLVYKGYVDQSALDGIVGATSAAVATIWSAVDKKRNAV